MHCKCKLQPIANNLKKELNLYAFVQWQIPQGTKWSKWTYNFKQDRMFYFLIYTWCKADFPLPITVILTESALCLSLTYTHPRKQDRPAQRCECYSVAFP